MGFIISALQPKTKKYIAKFYYFIHDNKYISLFYWHYILLLSSCTSSPFEVIVAENISIDTVAYSYVNINRFISVETDTTKINIRFPLLQGAPLKDSVQKAILDGVVGSDSLSKSLEDYANNFIADYQSYLKDEFSNHFPWEMDIDISVATNTANHFCIVANKEYEYMGGAHPNGYVIYSNFDRATGSIVGLGSIFENGTKEKLTVIAEKLFREQQQVDDSLSLANAGFFAFSGRG